MNEKRIKELFGNLDPFEEVEGVTKDIAPLWWYLDSHSPASYEPDEIREIITFMKEQE